MKMVVAILTCDRLGMTKRTVKSFLKHNNRENFDIFYGDDASTETEVHDFMDGHSIPCLVRHKKRQGCSPSSDELIHKALANSKAPYIIYLQNDFETVRPIPLEIVQRVMEQMPQVGWIRLYGKNKNNTIPGGNPINPTHKFKPGKPRVKWEPFELGGEQLELGDIHWCDHPAINRRHALSEIIKGAKAEHNASRAASKTKLLTVRFMRNITNHIGIKKTTPSGLFGKNWQTYEK